MTRYFILLVLAFFPKLIFSDCDIEKMERFSFRDENGQSQNGYRAELTTQSEVDPFQEDYGKKDINEVL
tara:strand:+ start:49 stop:255 length:207 start_codon:yes stop_codon:yes gene_type:complete